MEEKKSCLVCLVTSLIVKIKQRQLKEREKDTQGCKLLYHMYTEQRALQGFMLHVWVANFTDFI